MKVECPNCREKVAPYMESEKRHTGPATVERFTYDICPECDYVFEEESEEI